jgi:hypothetical protein
MIALPHAHPHTPPQSLADYRHYKGLAAQYYHKHICTHRHKAWLIIVTAKVWLLNITTNTSARIATKPG